MELRKKGVLKSLQDLRTFWDHMLSKESEGESSAVVAPVDRDQQGVFACGGFVCGCIPVCSCVLMLVVHVCVVHACTYVYGIYACVSVSLCVCVCVHPPLATPFPLVPCTAYPRAHIHQHRVVESRVLEEEEGEEDSSHSWAITAVPRADRGPSAGKQVSVTFIASLPSSSHGTTVVQFTSITSLPLVIYVALYLHCLDK